jgi:hypothetical protein
MQNLDKSLELDRREKDVQSAEERLLTRRKAVEVDEGESTVKCHFRLALSEHSIKEKPLKVASAFSHVMSMHFGICICHVNALKMRLCIGDLHQLACVSSGLAMS